MKIDGNRIQKRRDAVGTSQEQLAEAAGVSVSTVNRYERNKTRRLDVEILSAFAAELGCSVWDFFESKKAS